MLAEYFGLITIYYLFISSFWPFLGDADEVESGLEEELKKKYLKPNPIMTMRPMSWRSSMDIPKNYYKKQVILN